MRIILDTDKKTITVPWNYTDKLAAMNRTIKEAMGAEAKTLDFKQYLQDCWKYAMGQFRHAVEDGTEARQAGKEGLILWRSE